LLKTENNKIIIKKLLFILRLLFISLNALLMDMNSAIGAGLKKNQKNKTKNADAGRETHKLNTHLK